MRELCKRGFHPTKTPTTKWLKHGQICFIIPGHDPPLDITILCSEPIIITGDFNIHVDDLSDHNAIILLDMLECFGLQQHVN